MGVRYTGESQSGYNTNPPSDTPGDTSGTNQVEWAKHKQKLGDPVLTLSNDINAALLAQFDQGPVPLSVNTTTNAANYNQVLEVTGTTTISLMTAATATKGYVVTVKNAGFGVVTIDLATTSDALNGIVNGTSAIQANTSATYIVNNVSDGYESIAGSSSVASSSGSWTPVLVGLVTTGSPTYSKQAGTWYSIDNLVFITGWVTITAKGGMSGAIRITGLNDAARIGVNDQNAIAVSLQGGTVSTTEKIVLTGSVTQNTTVIDLTAIVDGGFTSGLTDARITDSFAIGFSAVYRK